MIDLTGKIAVVTGSSRGIGAAIAFELAKLGAKIVINHRNSSEGASAVLDKIIAAGGEGKIIQADVSQAEDAQRLIKETIDAYGQVDILVNNAGIYDEHPLVEVSYKDWQVSWQRTIATNLIGPANLSYCVARHMIEQGGGRIVNVSSRGAFRGEPKGPAYGASKAGLNSMSQSLAQALAPHNIFVCVGAKKS